MAFRAEEGDWQNFPDLTEEQIYPMYAPTNNFIDAIVGDTPNGSPARLGWSAMKIIEAANQSAVSGQNVVIVE